MGKKIYVGNMNYNTTQETLEATFGEFGAVTSVKIITDHVTGRPKGFAFIDIFVKLIEMRNEVFSCFYIHHVHSVIMHPGNRSA